jgi:hypothetical protein
MVFFDFYYNTASGVWNRDMGPRSRAWLWTLETKHWTVSQGLHFEALGWSIQGHLLLQFFSMDTPS